MYRVELTKRAYTDYMALVKSQPPSVIEKVDFLLKQLANSPRKGIASPHPLKGNWAGLWAIRVTQMIRIVYQIHDKRLVVEVISMRGHYEGLKKK